MDAANRRQALLDEENARQNRQMELNNAQEIRAQEALRMSRDAAVRADAESRRQDEQMEMNRKAGTRAETEAQRQAAEDARKNQSRLMAWDAQQHGATPEYKGVPYGQLPDYVRDDFSRKYPQAADEAPLAWDSAQRIMGNQIDRPGAGETITQNPRGEVTRHIAEPEAPTVTELAKEGIDGTNLSAAERTKALARARTEAREAALNKEKTMPASAVDKMAALQEISDLSKKMLIQIAPLKSTDIGPLDSGVIPAVKQFMGVSPEQGMAPNSKGYNDAINTYNTVRNIILRARSGGAVTPSEAERMLAEIGDPVKRAGTFQQDIANFVRNRMTDVDAHKEAMRQAGYNVPQPAAQTAQASPDKKALAQRALNDPNASEAHKLAARKILGL